MLMLPWLIRCMTSLSAVCQWLLGKREGVWACQHPSFLSLPAPRSAPLPLLHRL